MTAIIKFLEMRDYKGFSKELKIPVDFQYEVGKEEC